MFRFAYAIVDDDEDDYEPVQGANENFGNICSYIATLHLRSLNRCSYGRA